MPPKKPKQLADGYEEVPYGWELIDDIYVPVIFRQKAKYVPVRVVELKLLTRYVLVQNDFHCQTSYRHSVWALWGNWAVMMTLWSVPGNRRCLPWRLAIMISPQCQVPITSLKECSNLNKAESKSAWAWQNLYQVWSILPALGLLSLDCSSRRQMGSRTYIFVVGVILFVALDTNGGVWAIMQQGRKPH